MKRIKENNPIAVPRSPPKTAVDFSLLPHPLPLFIPEPRRQPRALQ